MGNKKLGTLIKYKNESDLVKACLNQKRDAQEQLYRTFADKMFAICKAYAKDRDEACEFLQLGFIKVFNKLENYSFKGSLEGWIRRVIVTTALQELRKSKTYHMNIDEMHDIQEVEQNEEIQKIPFQKVVEYVNELPKKAGLILKLYAIEGFSHKEIAEELSISVSTSKSQLNYARKLLNLKVSDQNG